MNADSMHSFIAESREHPHITELIPVPESWVIPEVIDPGQMQPDVFDMRLWNAWYTIFPASVVVYVGWYREAETNFKAAQLVEWTNLKLAAARMKGT